MERPLQKMEQYRSVTRCDGLWNAFGVTESDLVTTERKTACTKIRAKGKTVGNLYTVRSDRSHPRWVSFFDGAIDAETLGLWSSSAAGALVVPVAKRLAVVAFGYGRYLVDSSQLENSFGLRVALNCVDGSGVRTIDRKTFEGITTHVREQASKETRFSAFGLDVERDLLRAVVGTPTDPLFGNRLAGMDALHATIRVRLENLGALLERYVDKSRDGQYREKYSWIDNIVEVRDKSLIAKLDNILVGNLNTRDLVRKWLAVPDLMEWQDVGGFRYTRSASAELLSDVHFDSYFDQIKNSNELSVERLKRHRIVVFSATNEKPLREWSLYTCIYCELDTDRGTYLLNGGSWFALDQDFVKKVTSSIGRIPATAVTLPPCAPSESEAAYNRRLARTLAHAHLMDAKNVPHGGGKSQIEFCDVLTEQRVMYHVKRYSGSAVLSHLFAQGTVAATAFIADAEFRKALNPKLAPALRLTNPMQKPRARHYEIAFVIVSKSAKQLTLPFFSRVTLRNAVSTLEAYGYRVTLTKVPIG